MGFQKGGTVNISDAFESFGELSTSAYSCKLKSQQELMLSERSRTNNDLMWFVTLVQVLEHAVECTRTRDQKRGSSYPERTQGEYHELCAGGPWNVVALFLQHTSLVSR